MIRESHLTIHVSDMDKSVDFYTTLGFMLGQRWGNHYAQLTAPGLVIGLHPTRPHHIPGHSGNASIGLRTDDLQATKAFLDRLTIPYQERQEEGGHFLHFRDPDGMALYFIKPKW